MPKRLIKADELWNLRTCVVDANKCHEKCLELTGAKRMHAANKKALYRLTIRMQEIASELDKIYKSEGGET